MPELLRSAELALKKNGQDIQQLKKLADIIIGSLVESLGKVSASSKYNKGGCVVLISVRFLRRSPPVLRYPLSCKRSDSWLRETLQRMQFRCVSSRPHSLATPSIHIASIPLTHPLA